MAITKPDDKGYGQLYRLADFILTVMIDTGSTFTYLWPPLVDIVAEQFDAWTEGGTWMVDCANRAKNGSVNFGFDGIVINVRYKDFVVKNQDNTCSLGMQYATDTNVLGDTFIRGAYCEWAQ
jgi:Eukaryotic aspartyl protease